MLPAGLTIPKGAGTELGSQLFLRAVSGVRVVTPNYVKTVAGVTLKGQSVICIFLTTMYTHVVVKFFQLIFRIKFMVLTIPSILLLRS